MVKQIFHQFKNSASKGVKGGIEYWKQKIYQIRDAQYYQSIF